MCNTLVQIIKMLQGEKPQLNNARPFDNFLSVIFQYDDIKPFRMEPYEVVYYWAAECS